MKSFTKLVSLALPMMAAGYARSKGLTYIAGSGCRQVETGVCASLKKDVPYLGQRIEKFKSLSKRSIACAKSLGPQCEMILTGEVEFYGAAICRKDTGLGYSVGDHLLDGWTVDPKITVNNDYEHCAGNGTTTRAFVSETNENICLVSNVGIPTNVTVTADSIYLPEGANPTADFIIPDCEPVEGTTFTLTVSHSTARKPF